MSKAAGGPDPARGETAQGPVSGRTSHGGRATAPRRSALPGTGRTSPASVSEDRSAPARRSWRAGVPVWTGRILQTAGAWCLISLALIHALPRTTAVISTVFDVLSLPGHPSVVNGVVLIIVGAAARSRKRFAWWFVLIVYVLSSVLYLVVVGLVAVVAAGNPPSTVADLIGDPQPTVVKGVVTGAVALVLLVVLLASRQEFSTHLEPGRRHRAFGIVVGGVAASTALGFVLTQFFHGTLTTWSSKLIWSAMAATGISPRDVPGVVYDGSTQHGPWWVALILSTVSALALFAALATFAWSVRTGREMTTEDEIAVRRLLLEFGREDSLGYFNTRRDKSATFAPSRRAAVVFRVVGPTALASGDPVGDPEAWGQAIEAWLERSRDYGWTPAVLSATPEAARVYTEVARFNALEIGDEAVVWTDRFHLEGATAADVRTSVRRAEKAGYDIVCRRQKDVPEEELGDLGHLADRWRRGGKERGFSMALGRFADPADRREVVVVARDADGEARGLLTFVPWGRDGLSLDMMRHAPDAVSGLTEAMVAAVVAWGRDNGIRRISLNFAMFRSVFAEGSRVGASPWSRAMRRVMLTASRWWQLEQLYTSNEKYRPEWRPRLICWARGAQLSQVTLAAGRAEGQLPAWMDRLTDFGRANRAAKARPVTAAFVKQVRADEAASAQVRPVTVHLNDEERARRAKAHRLAEAGVDIHPVSVPRTRSIVSLREAMAARGLLRPAPGASPRSLDPVPARPADPPVLDPVPADLPVLDAGPAVPPALDPVPADPSALDDPADPQSPHVSAPPAPLRGLRALLRSAQPARETADIGSEQSDTPTSDDVPAHDSAASDLPAHDSAASDVPAPQAGASDLPVGAVAPLGQGLSIAGRVLGVRDHGGVWFADLVEAGAGIQVVAERDVCRDQAGLRRAVSRGDILSVTGRPGLSRAGEPSVLVTDWHLAAKCLSPVPTRRLAADAAARIPQRHAELATRPGAVAALRVRAAVVQSLRASLTSRGFLEVQTPMLVAVHGGATARPFSTHINAYDADLSLRIAPELALKRLCAGGVGDLFELGRSFRNEGADATHNPEFTSLEAYQAYGDYTTMRLLARDLIVAAAVAVRGRPVLRRPDGSEVDVGGQWACLSVHEAVSRAVGVELTPATPREDVARVAADHGIGDLATAGELVAELYDRLVEKATDVPTFYTDFPVECCPLTRVHRRDPRLAERWDLVAFGMELGTAYSELVDPEDQRARLTEQSVRAAGGDPEAMELDEEFLQAVEFGLPPMGGLGLGVDRVIMAITGTTIRRTLAFPFTRPRPAELGEAGPGRPGR